MEPPNPDDPASLTNETKAAIQQILANVVRASLADSGQALNDADLTKRISVFPHSFDKRSQIQASGGVDWWHYGLGALGLLAVGAAGYAVSRRRRPDIADEEVVPTKVDTLDLEAESSEVKMKKQLEQLARRKPDEFAKLLRTWITEE